MAKSEKTPPNPDFGDDKTKVLDIPLTGLLDENVPVGAFICNWDISAPENLRLLFLCERPSELKGNELAGAKISVKYWCCTKILIPERGTGEEVPVVRTVLIGEDDEVISSLSHGILRSTELLRRHYGNRVIEPPLLVQVLATKMAAGSDMLMFAPVAG